MEDYKNFVKDRLLDQANEVGERLEDIGIVMGEDYHFEGIYLQGSQNYNAHHENSDIDSKFVLVPTVGSMIKGTKLVYDLQLENGERVSVKPVLEYVNLFFKGNVNNLEILATDYFVGNGFLESLKCDGLIEEILYNTEKTFWDACLGMMVQKSKSLFKHTESTKEFFDKHGYDNKDLTHIIRIHTLLFSKKMGLTFKDSLDFSANLPPFGIVKEIRSGDVNKGLAESISEDYIQSAKDMYESVKPENRSNSGSFKECIVEAYVDHYKEIYL